MLLALDVGTTHCKAALVGLDGHLVRVASRPTPRGRLATGESCYEPDVLWQTLADTMREALAGEPAHPVAAVGIASMAETGLLVDARTGAPRTPFLPWFERCASAQVERIARESDLAERFCRTGLPPSFKYGLPKLLWLRERDPSLFEGARWLSVADFMAFCLTGQMATDPTLAARTYAFDVSRQQWDEPWLQQWGFSADLFPPVLPSGVPLGEVVRSDTPLPLGVPVAVAGHDHLCAALAVGAIRPGRVFNSIGTAETLLGALDGWHRVEQLGSTSGLSFGQHVVAGHHFWLGGLPASGGSVEWLRAILGEPPLSYAEVQRLLAEEDAAPTGILYFPYLSGSGAPAPDPHARAAFVGLTAAHGRAELLRAVLEGTAYEMEAIRRRAETVTGRPIERLIVAGGGTRNRAWLQIKADVSGVPLEISPMQEATLIGAALIAGRGSGALSAGEEISSPSTEEAADIVQPDPQRHAAYARLYEEGYQPLQEMVRRYPGGGNR